MTDYYEDCDHELLEYPVLDDSGKILYWVCRCGFRKEATLEDERAYDDEDFAG